MNAASVAAVASARAGPHWLRPLYDTYCFSRIPATVKLALTGEAAHDALPPDVLPRPGLRYQAVVLLFIDALGWRFIEPRLDDHPLLRHIARRGVVSKITSLFPSTTAAHVTCIHTGLAPSQSGIYEWNMYEPRLDRVYQPLPFSLAGEGARDTLSGVVDPHLLYPNRTLHQELNRSGVKSMAFQAREILPSVYSDIMLNGAVSRPYKTLAEAVINLGDALLNRHGPHYYFLYYGGVDTVAHQYGPNAAQVDAEIDVVLTLIERHLIGRLAGKTGDALLLLTADHGVAETDPRTTVYLNLQVPEIRGMLKLNRRGERIVPCGSPRDFFLHIDDDCLAEARDLLSDRLAGKAEVALVGDLIARGDFGPLPAAERFLDRVGNLVVLPYRGESVWWYEKDKFEQRFYGHHGGMTPVEMETPFLACELG